MVIGIDLRCLPADGSPGAGVAHAAREISRALLSTASQPDIRWVLYVPKGAFFDPVHRSPITELPSASGSDFRRALLTAPCSLLFVPGGAVARGMPAPAVPLVHDLAIFSHPEWFPQSPLRRTITTRLFRRGLLQAPRILCVSEDTKRELVSRFGIDPSVVSVTHEGGDTVLAALHGESLRAAKLRAKIRLADRGVTQPFILCLGTVEPRKNLPVALEAWKRSCQRFFRPADFLVAGSDGWKLASIHRAFEEAGRYPSEGGSRFHRVMAVSDEDRRDLLLAADIVAVPSLHEGFGLVALEAMQAETAVVASRAGALPEVVGEAGILLPPQDASAWAAAFTNLLNDDSARRHLAEQGKARSQGMTWERAARVALDVLAGVIR